MAKSGESIMVWVVSFILIAPGLNKMSSFMLAYSKSYIYTGVVVKEGVGKYTGCKPFIEYHDNEGNLREFKSEINYHFFFCPKKGDQIKLISNINQPSITYTVNLVQYIIIPIILILLGCWVAYSYFGRKGKNGKQSTAKCSTGQP